jgi:hypothetical protein
MSSNRIHYFIRSILQNSKLNREKFVKNKKICKVDWMSLSRNPNAIHILEKNLDKVDWVSLSRNPNAIHNQKKRNYKSILKRNYNPILKRNFTTNSSGLPPNNNNNNNDNKNNMILAASSIGIYTALEIFD